MDRKSLRLWLTESLGPTERELLSKVCLGDESHNGQKWPGLVSLSFLVTGRSGQEEHVFGGNAADAAEAVDNFMQVFLPPLLLLYLHKRVLDFVKCLFFTH